MTRRLALAAALAVVTAALMSCSPAREAPSAYGEELAKIDREIAAAAPDRLVYLRYTRASLTADFADFARAEQEIGSALHEAAPADELFLFRATLHVKLHRLAAAKDDLRRLTRLAGSPYVRLLGADIAMQEGRYGEARRAYGELLAADRSWDHLARAAYFEWKTGHPERADALYAEAQDGLTAKEMRSFAWVELQRGLIDFDRRRYADALAHYRRADRAYSGYWLIEEHIAEVLGLLGRTDEAVEIYERVIEKTRNPEYLSALGSLVERDDPGAAEELYRRADALFEERFARYPEAAAGHYVEHLLQRRQAGPRLLELAEMNHRLRPNAEAKLLLAKACLKLGREARARALLAEVAATPWRSQDLAELKSRLAQQEKSMKPRSTSTETSSTRTRSPTSSRSWPRVSRPSTG
jgi:tetratricopeptide (TPR) repeat protein